MLRDHKVNIFIFTLYILGMTFLMIWQGIGIAPDRYAFVLLLGSLLIKRTRRFLLDWLPFILILISYDFLRGLADNINPRIHYFPQMHFDELLFGQLPTVSLQKLFFQANFLHWYDFLFTYLYFLHFALPLGFAYILWLKNRDYFKEFMSCLLYLSYAAFLTYLAFPAAPPWLSAKMGYSPPITKILDLALQHFPERLHLPTIYHNFDPNLVAAIPSLHAAYPLLILLFAIRFFGWRASFFIIYVLATWVSIVYLGEHYVSDVILGALYALISFYTYHLLRKINLDFLTRHPIGQSIATLPSKQFRQAIKCLWQK